MIEAIGYVNSDLESEWYKVTGNLTRTLLRAKLPVASNPSSIKKQFFSADKLRQENFLQKCRFYQILCAGAVEEGVKLQQDKQFIWYTLQKLKLHPTKDLFEYLESGDHIEIYDLEGRQVFSNFEFCLKTSYTIEELFWYSWDTLFVREEKYLAQIMTAFHKAIDKAHGPFDPKVEPHECWESMAGHSNRALVKMKVFSPIMNKENKTKMMIAASEIQLID